jgi:DNA-binding NarL/FixJ family response regulator
MSPDLELASQDCGDSSAVESIARNAPDVAVIELDLPRFDHPLETIVLDEAGPSVLALSREDDGCGPMIYRAIEAGADGCLFKSADAETICDAIIRVAQGKTAIPQEVSESIASQIRLRRARSEAVLTDRERQILRLTAGGLSSEGVGQELSLGQSTVKTHLSNVYAKLGVTCAAAAVFEAMRLDLLS